MDVESLSPHSLISLTSNRRAIVRLFLFSIFFLSAAPAVLAQREYTVVKPRPRSATETVKINRRASQPTKGVLQVVLDPVIPGKVVITDAKGRVLDEAEAGEAGQVTFELKRGQSYLVKANSPGFVGAEKKSPILKAATSVRIQLKGQFAKLVLPGLPTGAQILIDGKLSATADQSLVVLDNIEPGQHTLLVRHPQYNDYQVDLGVLEAGSSAGFFPISTLLVKVAKLTIQGPADATVLIDGAVQGKINPDGVVRIDYELDQASERTISVELLGYQTWSKRETLSPGPRTITVKLDPIVTSAGVSDFFENLSLWNAPSSWKIVTESRNRKLEVKGEQLGMLKDKTYRDFDALFTIWLTDGKGATWTVRADSEGRNYYLFHLAGPNSTTHIPKRFYSYLVRDGGAPIEVSTPIPVLYELNQKDQYTVKVQVRGHVIKQFFTDRNDDVTDLGIWTDTTPTKEKFLYGSFGFRAPYGEVFTVDDFHIALIND